MVAPDRHDAGLLISAFVMAGAVPLGKALGRTTGGRLHAIESFAGGAGLAYVIVDLMVELAGPATSHVHALLPIGPTVETSLFAVVLAGASAWYVGAALAPRVGQARYLANALPHVLYRVVIGGALALETEHGDVPLLLFGMPMLMHLTVIESHLHREFEREHGGVVRAVLAFAPLIGAIGWALLEIPEPALFVALALVAGITFVQIIQSAVPSPEVVKIGPFLAGVCVYAAMMGARWAG
jgi:hypothetical protein